MTPYEQKFSRPVLKSQSPFIKKAIEKFGEEAVSQGFSRKHEGGRCLKAVYKCHDLDRNEKAVLNYLGAQQDFKSNFTEYKRHKHSTIAMECGFSAKTVQRAVKKLRDKGFLKCRENYDTDTGFKRANSYAIAEKLFDEYGVRVAAVKHYKKVFEMAEDFYEDREREPASSVGMDKPSSPCGQGEQTVWTSRPHRVDTVSTINSPSSPPSQLPPPPVSPNLISSETIEEIELVEDQPSVSKCTKTEWEENKVTIEVSREHFDEAFKGPGREFIEGGADALEVCARVERLIAKKGVQHAKEFGEYLKRVRRGQKQPLQIGSFEFYYLSFLDSDEDHANHFSFGKSQQNQARAS